MTELETDTGAVDVIDNVLRMPLEPVQLALLSAIWEPVHDSQSFQTEAWWPTWDFVSRRVYETHPEVTDAAEVLRHLPRTTVFMGVPTYYVRLLAEPGFDSAACRTAGS